MVLQTDFHRDCFIIKYDYRKDALEAYGERNSRPTNGALKNRASSDDYVVHNNLAHTGNRATSTSRCKTFFILGVTVMNLMIQNTNSLLNVPNPKCHCPYVPCRINNNKISQLFLSTKDNNNDDESERTGGIRDDSTRNDDNKGKKKNNKNKNKKKNQWLETLIDPYSAGKKFRKSLDSLSTLPGLTPPKTKASDFILDEVDFKRKPSSVVSRTSVNEKGGVGKLKLNQQNEKDLPLSTKLRLYKLFDNPIYEPYTGEISNDFWDDDAPEVLIIGASGKLGRLIVKRLLRDLKTDFRVRVLVRDLYSSTLNLLGSGVTYCQGDLLNIDSLEYAVTDVDKIIFCAAPPSPSISGIGESKSELVNVMERRRKLAEEIDVIGMRNILQAYQNVRYADYGSSQTPKRTLFKFHSTEKNGNDDFNVFSVMNFDNQEEMKINNNDEEIAQKIDKLNKQKQQKSSKKTKTPPSINTKWIKNKFGNAVFTGIISPQMSTLMPAIISARLRDRDDQNMGLDFKKNGFGGFIVRLCGDGNRYECFIRTSLHEESKPIEYVCSFTTNRKTEDNNNNISKNKFVTVRLPFSKFIPTDTNTNKSSEKNLPTFDGSDVRQIGFRIKQPSTQTIVRPTYNTKKNKINFFYIAVSYIKIYRSNIEPEFIYVSDSSIPEIISNQERMAPNTILEQSQNSEKSLNEVELNLGLDLRRFSDETYFKFLGEQFLRNSGLSYTILRISGFNDSPVGNLSNLSLVQTASPLEQKRSSSYSSSSPVSRVDVAEIVARCLLDPNTCNTTFQIFKGNREEERKTNLTERMSRLVRDS